MTEGKGNADARYEAWTTEGEAVVDSTSEGGRCRARELGMFFGTGKPGPMNGITDVEGVRVGHTTIVQGQGKIEVVDATDPAGRLPITSCPTSRRTGNGTRSL